MAWSSFDKTEHISRLGAGSIPPPTDSSGVGSMSQLRVWRKRTQWRAFAQRTPIHLCGGAPTCAGDITHPRFGIDHNRQVLCTPCVRGCDEVEGVHTWDIAGRGANSRAITDLNQPRGAAQSCTSCGKCAMACPTGAIFLRGSTVAEMQRDSSQINVIVNARKQRW